MAQPDPPPLAAPWREPVRGGHPGGGAIGRSGLEQLRAAMTGGGPEPPLNHLTGMRLTAIGEGTASFRMPLTGWWRGVTRAVEIGAIAIPADAAMACAIMTLVAPYSTFTTSELALRVLAEPAPHGELLADARVIAPGPPLALAEVFVRDGAGTLVAHGSSSCLILDGSQPLPDPPPYPPAAGSLDPWERTPPDDLAGTPAGAGQLRSIAAGALAPPPLHLLTGIDVGALGDGRAELSLPATPWFCAPPPGRVQGGVIALIADAAHSVALGMALPAAATLAPVELKLNYVRPLASDGRRALARAAVVHAGRRTAVATSVVTNAGGATIAVCSGSGLVAARR